MQARIGADERVAEGVPAAAAEAEAVRPAGFEGRCDLFGRDAVQLDVLARREVGVGATMGAENGGGRLEVRGRGNAAHAAHAHHRQRPYPLVVVAPAASLATDVPQAAAVAAATVRLDLSAVDATLDFAALQAKLLAAGYERVPEVMELGQFSVRGGVLDAWSPDEESPVRAEFFGDDLESLRTFDPALQTSTGKLGSAEFVPVELKGEGDEKGERVEKGGCVPPLLRVLPDGATVLFLEHNDYSTLIPQPSQLLSTPSPFSTILYTGDPAPRGVPTGVFQSSPIPGFAELGIDAARNPELLDAARARLQAYLVAAEKKGAQVVEDAELGGGFEVPGLVVVAKSDRVFAHRRKVSGSKFHGAGVGERFTENSTIISIKCHHIIHWYLLAVCTMYAIFKFSHLIYSPLNQIIK